MPDLPNATVMRPSAKVQAAASCRSLPFLIVAKGLGAAAYSFPVRRQRKLRFFPSAPMV